MNDTSAHRQWATRPADERFPSVTALHDIVSDEAARSHEETVNLKGMLVTTSSGTPNVADIRFDPAAPGKRGVEVTLSDGKSYGLTPFAFEQLSRIAGAPPSYLTERSPDLAVQCLREGLSDVIAEAPNRGYQFLITDNVIRGITSKGYCRIWDHEVTEQARDIGDGWVVPPGRPAVSNQKVRPATEEDVLKGGKFGLSINIGDMIGDAGVYRGDRDLFILMVNPDRNFDDGAGNAISRAVMFWNSEVGYKSIGFKALGFKHVCGNHILWGTKDVLNIRRIHRGDGTRRVFEDLKGFLKIYADGSTTREQVMIAAARTKLVAETREDVVKKVGAMAFSSQKIALDAMLLAEQHYDTHRSDPKSFWGMVEGLTYLSQRQPNADTRLNIEKIGGKLMDAVC